MGNGPIFCPYSDDNEKNTFNNGGNNRHGLENITCTFNVYELHCNVTEFQFSQG